MSWLTIAWTAIGSASLTLALMHGLVWWKQRSAWTELVFSLTAGSAAVFTLCELWLLRSETPEQIGVAMRWAHLPVWVLLLSLTAFVRLYLRAGWAPLAWACVGLRTVTLLVDFLVEPNVNFRAITAVQRIPFLGELASVPVGVPNPWSLAGQLGSLALVLFTAGATVTVWRRGEHRKAMLGATIVFFILGGQVQAVVVAWGFAKVPVMVSVFYVGIVAAMGYELSRDVFRASQLVHQLQASDAELRESGERMRQLSGRLLSAQEDERRLIARELHDNLSQQLALFSIEIDALARSEDRATVAESMRQLGGRAVEMSTEVHSLSHRLHSAKLDTLGLQAAVEWHCRELRARGLQVHCLAESVPPALPYEIGLCLFRILQEGLNNVVKHSGASEARVTLAQMNGDLVLTIADSGRGFDATAATLRNGIGLASMRERVHLIGGELTVTSEQGHGTTIRVSAPIPSL